MFGYVLVRDMLCSPCPIFSSDQEVNINQKPVSERMMKKIYTHFNHKLYLNCIKSTNYIYIGIFMLQ